MDGLTFNASINIAIGQYTIISDEEYNNLADLGPQESTTDSSPIKDNFSMAERNQLAMNKHLLNS